MKNQNGRTPAISLILLCLLPGVGAAQINIERVSVDSNGNEAVPGPNPECGPGICLQGSTAGTISADGRYVAFDSHSTNLIVDDTNGAGDIFLKDRSTGETSRISVAQDGSQLPQDSNWPFLSSDARYLTFKNAGDGIVPDDLNGSEDVFSRDLLTEEIIRISVPRFGEPFDPSESLFIQGGFIVSADGRHAVFHSRNNDVVPNDPLPGGGLFAHDLDTGFIEQVDVMTGGTAPEDGSTGSYGAILDGGQFFFFNSDAVFSPQDTNEAVDCFLRDRVNGTTIRISLTSTGEQIPRGATCLQVTPDGRFVPIKSADPNLVANDMNDRYDLFLLDRSTGEYEMINVATDGTQSNHPIDESGSNFSYLSDDGRFVVYSSLADNLIPGDPLGVDDRGYAHDVFLRDRATATTHHVSVGPTGILGDGNSLVDGITGDGRYIVFTSDSTNLVPDDTNCVRDVFVVETASIINAGPFVPIGEQPYALADRFELGVGASTDLDVLANDTGLADAPIAVEIACAPVLATVAINADNTIAFSMPEDLQGAGGDGFRYRITDADGDQFTARVVVHAVFDDGGGSGGGSDGNAGDSGGGSNNVASGGGGSVNLYVLIMSVLVGLRGRKRLSCRVRR